MRRLRWVVAVLAVAGCGVRPSGVAVSDAAVPTGVAPGVTLYFVDADGRLQPEVRPTGHLGTVADALAWLLAGPGGGGNLHTEIDAGAETQVVVTATPEVIQLITRVSVDDVTPRGIDQIVCTALAAHVQAGGSMHTKVQVRFTVGPPEVSAERRTCPRRA